MAKAITLGTPDVHCVIPIAQMVAIGRWDANDSSMRTVCAQLLITCVFAQPVTCTRRPSLMSTVKMVGSQLTRDGMRFAV